MHNQRSPGAEISMISAPRLDDTLVVESIHDFSTSQPIISLYSTNRDFVADFGLAQTVREYSPRPAVNNASNNPEV